jgi:hypothetical protein
VINKVILFLYHACGTLLLYGVLLWTLWFCGKLLFYVSSNSWIVPTVITKEDPSVLDVAQKIITTQQALDALNLEVQKDKDSMDEMKAHRRQLSLLYPKLVTAIRTETSANSNNGRRLSTLDVRAVARNEKLSEAVEEANGVAKQIDDDLSVGLITKSDAAVKKEQIAQQSAAVLDNQINEVLLKDQILQKTTTSTQALDVLDKRAELGSQIATLDISLEVAERQLNADNQQIDQLKEALRLVDNTPYAAVLNGGQTFAFVPYSDGTVEPGTPVFSCNLDFIFCRKVGEITKVFSDEEHEQNPVSIPLLSATIRGVVAQIKLQDSSAVKSQTLFLHHAPLFF